MVKRSETSQLNGLSQLDRLSVDGEQLSIWCQGIFTREDDFGMFEKVPT